MKIYHWILSPSFWHICYPTSRLIQIIEGSTNMLVNLWLNIFVTNSVDFISIISEYVAALKVNVCKIIQGIYEIMKIYHWILSPSFWHICYPTFRLIQIIEGSTNMLVNLWLNIFVTNSVDFISIISEYVAALKVNVCKRIQGIY